MGGDHRFHESPGEWNLCAPNDGVPSRRSGGFRGRRSPVRKTPIFLRCRESCEELFLRLIGQSPGPHPARKNTTFFLQEQGPQLSARTEGMAINWPSLIAVHSPFRFDNLRPGEAVLYRVFWGAIHFGYKLASPRCLSAAPAARPLSQTIQRYLREPTSPVGKAASRGGARSTPGFSPDPKFSLANSPVSPVDRLRLLTAPYSKG